MRFWMLEAETEARPGPALAAVRDALQNGGGIILEARQLGGLALVVRFECAHGDVEQILDALHCTMTIRKGNKGPGEGEGEIHASLHMTLVGSGDERIVIPAVPG